MQLTLNYHKRRAWNINVIPSATASNKQKEFNTTVQPSSNNAYEIETLVAATLRTGSLLSVAADFLEIAAICARAALPAADLSNCSCLLFRSINQFNP